MSEREPDPKDIFKILVATDIHLGHEEADPVRGPPVDALFSLYEPVTGDDSFIAFEEILQLAQKKDVDLILLAGDLFDITHPSSTSLLKCMSLLRQYCMGDRPVMFEHLSEPSKNFANTTQTCVNYEDPNMNVSIPVYSIHGNHDDPTGETNTCSLDILSSAGLINFIGKSIDLKEISVSPVLLQKGETRLAVYGMSHITDKRLYRLMEEGKVKFERPSECPEDWFNILMVHQNRIMRKPKDYLPEEKIPDFMSLVVWGHEHDCRVKLEKNDSGNFYITQPGSSVVTSLSEGESIPKNVALVQVHKQSFQLHPIPLQTVRPFIFRDIDLSECDVDEDVRDPREVLEGRAEEEVYSMLSEAEKKLTGNPKQPKLPLLRLRVFYQTEDQMFNQIRFGQKFEEAVANPSSLVLYKKRSIQKKEIRDVLDTKMMEDVLPQKEEVWDVRVEDFIKKYFRNVDYEADDKYRMNVLTVAGLNEAVTNYVDRQHTSAIDDIVKYQSDRMRKHLMTVDIDDNNIGDEIRRFSDSRMAAEDEEAQESRSQLDRTRGRGRNGSANGGAELDFEEEPQVLDEADDRIDEDEDLIEEPVEEVSRGRGRGRGRARTPRAARAPRAPRGSRAASSAASRVSAASASTRGRGRRGTPQQTLQESFAKNNSQISVVRASGRNTSRRSNLQFIDDDDD